MLLSLLTLQAPGQEEIILRVLQLPLRLAAQLLLVLSVAGRLSPLAGAVAGRQQGGPPGSQLRGGLGLGPELVRQRHPDPQGSQQRHPGTVSDSDMM